MARQGKPNQALQGAEIDQHAAIDASARTLLRNASMKLGWSARSTHRALKVARTIADMAASDTVRTSHIAEAVQYRRTLKQAG
ncbi:MAG TPA: hypothetical protein VLJ19_19850 [Variovorax sp.]|nr:hypothetical protein [Variovorax sp.]